MVYRFKNLIFALVPVALIVSIRTDFLVPAEGDEAWFLHALHQWFSGRHLYADILELNPPLILWLYALPVLISGHVSRLADYQALAVFGTAACIFSALVGTVLIARHPAFEGRPMKQLKFFFLQLLIFIFYTTQPYFFGREHIMVVLGLPYIIRFMPRMAGRQVPLRLRIMVGCMAAVAFCIKPHAMLVFALLQLLILLQGRSLRALLNLESLIVAVFAVLYVLAVWLFTPDYFRIITPMAFWTYRSFRNENAGYFLLPPFFIGLAFIFAGFRLRQQTPYRRDVPYLAGICFAFLAYSLINHGWAYTYNPLYCMLMLTAGWMLWEYDWLRRENETRGTASRSVWLGLQGCFIVFIAHAAYMCFFLAVTNHDLDRLARPCYSDPACYRDSPYVSYFVDHNVHSFSAISLESYDWTLLMRNTGAEWVTPANLLWMLPRLLLEGKDYTQKHGWIVEWVAKRFASDLNNRKPEVVFVDSSPALLGRGQSSGLLGLLSSVTEFSEAWRHYHYGLTFNGCGRHYDESASECRYDLFIRDP